MACQNPFDNPEFMTDIQTWLLGLPADTLRNKAREVKLISDQTQLRALRNQAGNETVHNEELLGIIMAQEEDGYLLLCEAVRAMGYARRYDQMMKLLPDSLRPVDPPVEPPVKTPDQPPKDVTPIGADIIPNGLKMLGECHLQKLAAKLGPVVDTQEDDFARWAVQLVDPDNTGSEPGVLNSYLRTQTFNASTQWSSVWCVLSYLSNQVNGPNVNAVYEKLKEIKFSKKRIFLQIFKDDSMYL